VLHFRLLVVALAAASLALPGAAFGSEVIDRNASNIQLKVSRNGKQALLLYRARGRQQHVLAWGAKNAIAPTRARKQLKFKLDYSGGWSTYRKNVWKTFTNHCRPYDGPTIQWVEYACKASDGSYWAVQKWQRQLPNFGLNPNYNQAVWELRLSHWSGPLPQFVVKLNWARWGPTRVYDHLFGYLRYRGKPVYGFRSTPAGVPLDTFGRNIYLDTFNSKYGRGWKRENSFLTHKGNGVFCYGFYPHGSRPEGSGERYRATVIGPGVTPDMFWQEDAPGPFDEAIDAAANEELNALGDPLCRGR
jgi:hypothetical protein